MKTHTFTSTGEAYNACQCSEDIEKGDVLVIESERVIGLADTWPTAITVDHGHLHSMGDVQANRDHFGAYAISAAVAAAYARGFRVIEELDK